LAKLFNRTLPAYAIPVAIVAVGVLLFLVLLFTKSSPDGTKSQEREWLVNAQSLTPGTHRPQLILYGKVESPMEATIEAAVEADVAKTLVKEGDVVKQGQLLLQLDPREAQLVLMQRQAEVDELKAGINSEKQRYQSDQQALAHQTALYELAATKVRREKELMKRGAGSEVDIDRARETMEQQALNLTQQQLNVADHVNRLNTLEAKLAQARALRDKARLDVDRTQILAPFAGRVTALSVSVGDRVQPGEPLLEIFDKDSVELRVQIPSRYLPDVRNDLAAGREIKADAIVDGRDMVLQVDRLAGAIGRGRGGTDALLLVLSGSEHLELGRTVEIILKLAPEDNIFALPESAVYGRNRVYKIVQGRLQPVYVTIVGQSTNGKGKHLVLIESEELKAGDSIITTQLSNARQGLKVKVAQDKVGG